MNCECCEQQHDGKYGSGRFCSKTCSRRFSTKSKRKEINEKIKKTLTLDPYDKTCEYCKSSFLTKKKHQKFCARSCAIKSQHEDPEIIEKWRSSRLKEIEKGNVGYGIKTEFNGIRCDSALEYAFLKWYLSKYPDARIKRFKGYLEGEGIKYQPDFIIDDKIIVEVKYTSPYIGDKLSEKWKTYVSTQEAKKKLLSNQEHLWITEKDIGYKFYRECLKEIKASKVV